MSKMLKTFAAACMLLFLVQPALANDEKYKAAPIMDSRLKKDSFSTVTDTVFFNTTLNPLISSSRVLNLVTFRINEYANIVLPSSFTAKVKFRVDLYTTTTSYTTVYDSLTISYSTTGNYDRLKVYTNNIGYKAIVTLTDSIIVTGATSAQVLPALALDNEIWVTRDYTFTCSSGITTISYADSVSGRGELQVFWDFQPTATEYDLEWSYIDSTARTEYMTGGNFDAAKIFVNNATRVTISGTSYYIPMMYDNGGILFYRVRPVQVLPGNQRMEATWSSAYTYGMGRYDYGGHERGLNWQATTSFAEEGKRETVVQYFDGTLRGRQTVTKDNTTNTTVVAETFYDYQGRGVIQVLPAPTLDRLIKHTPAFNQFTTGGYAKDIYDPVLTGGVLLCNTAASDLDSNYGAAKYYSSLNPLVNNDEHRFIPNSFGYPFTETQYSTDGTDRVLKQSGVGPTYALNTDKATQYFYGTADREDLDLLFGTEAGEASHYSKNMVRDANGQFSVSYMDMHGRIVATALAGDNPASLDTILSKNTRSITKSLIDASNTIIDGHSIITTKTFPVALAGNHRFKYSLWPDSLSLATCDSNVICYDCMYDLEVTIWGECYNSSAPLVIRRSNLSINPADTACGTANIPLAIDTLVYLDEGEYIVTKKLTISMAGFEYLRDSVYMKRNLCKTKEDFIQEVMDSIKNNLECERTCSTCEAELGTWSSYRPKYMEANDISPADSADFRDEAYAAWLELKEECDELCDSVGRDKSIRYGMLADLTPPNGQYANPNAIDEFSIFSIINSQNGTRKYQRQDLQYYDEHGNPDSAINTQGIKVAVKELDMQEFTNNFQPRWAETLLPLHPEYCKLQQIEVSPLPESYVWDEVFAKEESYSVAINKGWLNPTSGTGSPFNLFPTPSSGDRDPFFADASMSVWKAEMEDSMKYKVNAGGNISMWALATIVAKCDGKDSVCIDTFRLDSNAMDSTLLCSAEADMAWKAFRNMYLQEKREIISKMLTNACPNTPVLNPPYYSHFPDPAQAVELMDSYPTLQSVNDSIDALVDRNCRSYVNQWWNELRPCNFNSTDSAVIIPKLINVCKEGGDRSHIFGSSTISPGSTSTDISFEQVLKDYCTANSIPYDTGCNVYLIKAPRPYNQQNVLVDQVVLTMPDSCQCEQLDKYRNEYNRYRDSGETFAGYLARTINSTLSAGQLDTLQQACNGTLGCNFISHPIVLPPAFQCGITEVCFDCVEVRKLHKAFTDEFSCTPVKIAASAAEEQVNRIYTAFMNNKTGFSKYAYEYLEFLDSCPPSPTTTCDSLLQIVKEYRHHGNSVRASWGAQTQDSETYNEPYQVIGLENSGNGFMRFPDSVRKRNVGWYNNLYILFNPGLCFPDGYEVEMKMKILRDTVYSLAGSSGNSHYLNAISSNIIFSRYVTPIPAYGVTYPPGIFLEDISNIPSGQNIFAPLNIDTNAIFEWNRYRVKFTKKTVSVYCNNYHVRTVNRDSTVPLSSVGTVVAGIRSSLGAVDDVKIRDHNGTLVYFESFNDTLYPAIPDSSAFCSDPADCEILFRNTFNTAMGTSYTYQQVLQYYQTHCGYIPEICGPPYDRGPKLCGKLEATFPDTTGYPTACSDTLEQAIETGTILYNYYRDSVIKAFENAYIQKCLQNASKETFTVTHTMSEYHYTLYYYDQAGALVKTVPPQGVDYWLNKLKDDVSYGSGNFETGISTWLDEVAAARAAGTNKTVNYYLGTNYRYNTLGQVTQQKSPDGGLSKFWYDRLGRLVISQNAKQKAHSDDEHYSYTLYDYLGRISEVGQLENSEADMSQTISRDTTSLKNWIAANAAAKEQVTRTYYDIAPSNSLTGTEIYPRNLRNRVSYTTLTDGASTATAGYNYASFYTYDIHGNVDTLLHDYGLGTSPPMGTVNIPNIMNMNGNRYKKIVYNYDLISGKVNLAQYSPGKVDRFYHRYEYDAENRITDVYTSADSIIWERDANYRYYKHGPLARTVLGEQQVQGIDYGYTLQGWLKGVNSTGIADAFYDFDMGNDGLSAGSNQYVARDALAFNLNYFDGDYEAINNTVSPFATVNYSHISDNYRPLYNGNISSMAVSIGQFGNTWLYNYKYDQLNRIRSMDLYNNAYDANANIWTEASITEEYKERVKYDANGNILRYLRNMAENETMDSLQYWYQYKTTGGSMAHFTPEAGVPSNAVELTNKLAYVDDIISDGVSGVDIDGQAPGNYTYDEIGNLIADVKENIIEIKWSVYGKILEIYKEAGDDKTYIKYIYDASGNRIGKTVTKEGSVNSVEHTWYVRDAQGNTMAVYNYNGGDLSDSMLTLKEHHLYGSTRLGILSRDVDAELSLAEQAELNGNILTFTRGNKFFELSNHLGNVLTTISDRKTPNNSTIGAAVTYYKPVIITANDYYPFGMLMPGRNYNDASNKDYRYGFNGKENDNDVKNIEGGHMAFEARAYDVRLARFFSPDNFEKQFPEFSPYIFAGNRPTSAVDKKGDSLYILFYTEDALLVSGSDMFHAAAITRNYDIQTSGNFDPKRDKVVVLSLRDMSDVIEKVNKTVQEYSKIYGQTVEVGIYSHGSYDGPVGAIETSKYNLEVLSNQMTTEGWSKIEFNWANNGENCRVLLMGCRTGDDPSGEKQSFTTQLSNLANFKNVTIWGPTGYTKPSSYTDKYEETGTENGKRTLGENKAYRTYMLPRHSRKDGLGNHLFGDRTLYPMRISKNGEGLLTPYQLGTQSTDSTSKGESSDGGW